MLGVPSPSLAPWPWYPQGSSYGLALLPRHGLRPISFYPSAIPTPLQHPWHVSSEIICGHNKISFHWHGNGFTYQTNLKALNVQTPIRIEQFGDYKFLFFGTKDCLKILKTEKNVAWRSGWIETQFSVFYKPLANNADRITKPLFNILRCK